MSRAAVLGHPVEHSLSPVLHRAAYAELGLDWTYEAIDVDEHELAGFVASCGPEWRGLSLTMPLKQAILGLLDHVEPLAEVVGAVNTVLFQPGGSRATLVGANTDVYGIVAALQEAGLASGGAPARGVVLGAGATAASALAALGQLGITSPAVHVRSLARTGTLRRAAHRMGVEPTFHQMDAALPAILAADVVVSTLPAHAADPLAEQLVAAAPERLGVLLDVVYDPRPSALRAAWAPAGAVAGGERMLLHQAAEQVRLMTGRTAPVGAMSAALDAALEASPPSDTV